MAKYETLKAKADKLLADGDALSKSNPAESHRLLRKCRRMRLKARAAIAKATGAAKEGE